MSKLYDEYKELMFKISSYDLAANTSYLDMETIAPDKGAEYRNSRLAYLSGEIYSMKTEGRLYELLLLLEKDESLTDVQKRIVKWHLKDIRNMKCVPKDVIIESSKLTFESQSAWEKAKNENDYSIFKPYLLKQIEMTKKIVSYRKGNKKDYDVLLDDYEPGMNMEIYDRFFNLVKEKLVPLIKKINETQQIDDRFNYDFYPAQKQKEFMKDILKYIDFDFEAGVLLESEHPFTDSLSKYDTRITTHYYENILFSSIFSVIHEAGHANYGYQVSDEIAESFCFSNMSSGMHESQSRFYENYLGRRYHFWDNLFDKLKGYFPEQLSEIEQEEFVKAINKSEPSFIRTEADELTYPLHIMIRYEIEKGVFDGSIDVENLDKIWNEKYKEYLGIDVKDDRTGILQDIHWSQASFGYFPTYALGSAYGAQFLKAMEKDLDIDKCLADNNFKAIKQWLKEKIHQYGGLYLPAEQIEMATGEKFNPEYYVEYLREKYSKLYNIE